MKHYDVAIIGSGMVGLSLAALLAKHDFSVAVIESKEPTLNWDSNDLTARVSAIHITSKRLFDYIDVWKDINPINYAPLEKMAVWDYAGSRLDFDSADANTDQMGWIVENRAIVKALWTSLQQNPKVDFHFPCEAHQLVLNDQLATLTLNNHTTITAALVVGADGANSWLRQQMPVTLETRPYYHKAMVAVIESERPHHNCAYQKFLETGPVAVLPSAHPHRTSLVWSADHALSDELLRKPSHEFNQSLSNALDYQLGELKAISKRFQFPLIMRHADDYVSENCALIGDAAHTIHPLAGLGANLGFMDAACLAQTLIDARTKQKAIGSLKTLRRYARWRKADNTSTMFTMRALQNIFGTNDTMVNFIRSAGTNTINQCAFAKKKIMQMAMGESDDLPVFLHRTF